MNKNNNQQKTSQPHKECPWREWGPYLSERQWGTVREDYSANGDAWNYLTHDHSRSRAYRWGEDGIAGISDQNQHLCLAAAMWNGKDSIIKERLFGLTSGEGNHGEDVKEHYHYLDATPTHSYLKMLYKYPQNAFPYEDLINTNAARGYDDDEYELIETGAFDNDRYFDVFVEYAKADTEDILMRMTAVNRASEAAEITLMPQLWFRNNWSWDEGVNKPSLKASNANHITVDHEELGEYHFYIEKGAEPYFCENNTNTNRFQSSAQKGPFKDGLNDFIVTGDKTKVAEESQGTKLGAIKRVTIEAGGEATMTVRLSRKKNTKPFANFDKIFKQRITDADAFYDNLQCGIESEDARNVQRQAYAGMIWTKQFYYYDVSTWLEGDGKTTPPPEARKNARNSDWTNLRNADIISMPDKWEYPWYAAWDLAFHCIPLAYLDPSFAKHQLKLMTKESYMHPNGQLPAYEWNFSDVNPPVHAWATLRVFQIDRKITGKGDYKFLESVFHKLMLNFTWWVNRKDASGRNVFQGGFLGLDNIGVFDRSDSLPTGGYLNQADGTSWMAMFCLNMMKISLELATQNDVYEDIASKFFEHFLYIANAMTQVGEGKVGLWDDEDKFYYDVLNLPDGSSHPLKVRSMVGLIPLFAVETIEPGIFQAMPRFAARMASFLKENPKLAGLVSNWEVKGSGKRRLLSLLRGHRMKALLRRMLDETEFLSPYGIRALSRHHHDQPYHYEFNGNCLDVTYAPAESQNGMFGGNSNWRGPVWFPVNYLIIESLQKFHHYYGDDFKIECPTNSGNFMTILEVANEVSRRLVNLFLLDEDGNRPAFTQYEKMNSDPNFRDNLLFHEYFHGDTGRGVGASHQTGWTGLVAKLIQNKGCFK